MGNTVSVPPREPFVNQQASYNTMLRNVNQSRSVGNPDPVTQVGDEAILKAASPRGFNLTQATMADRSEMKTKAEECRVHQGIGGIRDLTLQTGVRTAYEPGCGWIYKKNDINRGAFGSEGDAASPNNPRAPVFSRVGELDEVIGGASFNMDLEKIERLVSKDMVNGITTCQGMASKVGVADVAPYIGYCKTSGRVIPVQRTATGGVNARFKDDVEFKCASDQIILPENTTTCPTGTVTPSSQTLGFKNYERIQNRGRNIDNAFHQPNWALNNQRAAMPSPNGGFAYGAERHGRGTIFGDSRREGFAQKEGFTIGTPFESCTGNLVTNNASKDCIKLAANQAGFENSGSFLKFMSSALNSTAPPVFENYRRLKTNTDFNPSTFTNGTKTINDIINILTLVRLDISNSNIEISKAARDIVSDSGLYEADYNLCSWIENATVDTNLINTGDTTTEKCLQNFWRNGGGDSRGIEFPTLAKWTGQTIGQFKQSFQLIASDINSTNMDTQSLAINNKYGVNSYKENVTTNYIPRPRDCERELVSSTLSSCPATVTTGQSIPNYTINYRVKTGKDAVAGGAQCVLTETKACTPTICDPLDCIGGWTESSCSTTCGAGTKTKTYVVTRAAQCIGAPCAVANGTVESNITCKARECAADDCKYTSQVVTECPTLAERGSTGNCGKQFKRKTNYVPQQNYSSDISSKCPTTPLEEPCAVVACPVVTTPAAAPARCSSWKGYANTNMAQPQCPPGSSSSAGAGRCHKPTFQLAAAACINDPSCKGITYDNAGYEPRNMSWGMAGWNGFSTWECVTPAATTTSVVTSEKAGGPCFIPNFTLGGTGGDGNSRPIAAYASVNDLKLFSDFDTFSRFYVINPNGLHGLGGVYFCVKNNTPATTTVATTTQAAAPPAGYGEWYGIASSSDGSKLVTGKYGGYIYTSKDYGATWTPRTGAGTGNWHAFASSANGQYLVTGKMGGHMYTSADSGINWTRRDIPGFGTGYWYGFASSATGQNLVTGNFGGNIYYSTNYGVTWTQGNIPGVDSGQWYGFASSDDGTKVVTGSYGGYIYTSTDSGANWTQRTGAGTGGWHGFASSANGAKLVTGEYTEYIYTSTDYGATWTKRTSAGEGNWRGFASSSDGTKLLTGNYGSGGSIYISTDSGINWIQRPSAGLCWGFASSDDGSKLAIGSYSGYIRYSTDSGATWNKSE